MSYGSNIIKIAMVAAVASAPACQCGSDAGRYQTGAKITFTNQSGGDSGLGARIRDNRSLLSETVCTNAAVGLPIAATTVSDGNIGALSLVDADPDNDSLSLAVDRRKVFILPYSVLGDPRCFSKAIQEFGATIEQASAFCIANSGSAAPGLNTEATTCNLGNSLANQRCQDLKGDEDNFVAFDVYEADTALGLTAQVNFDWGDPDHYLGQIRAALPNNIPRLADLLESLVVVRGKDMPAVLPDPIAGTVDNTGLYIIGVDAGYNINRFGDSVAPMLVSVRRSNAKNLSPGINATACTVPLGPLFAQLPVGFETVEIAGSTFDPLKAQLFLVTKAVRGAADTRFGDPAILSMHLNPETCETADFKLLTGLKTMTLGFWYAQQADIVYPGIVPKLLSMLPSKVQSRLLALFQKSATELTRQEREGFDADNTASVGDLLRKFVMYFEKDPYFKTMRKILGAMYVTDIAFYRAPSTGNRFLFLLTAGPLLVLNLDALNGRQLTDEMQVTESFVSIIDAPPGHDFERAGEDQGSTLTSVPEGLTLITGEDGKPEIYILTEGNQKIESDDVNELETDEEIAQGGKAAKIYPVTCVE